MSLPVTSCFKRWFPYDELISENAHAPNIYLIIVCDGVHMFVAVVRGSAITTPSQHLRRQVVQRATHCLSTIRRCVYTPSKVSKFYRSETVQQVFRLDVPMNYITRVDILERLNDLQDVLGSSLLRVASIWLRL